MSRFRGHTWTETIHAGPRSNYCALLRHPAEQSRPT